MVPVGVGYALSQLSVAMTFAFVADGTAQGERLAQIAGWATVLLRLVGVFPIAIGFLFPSVRVQSHGWARFMRLFWAFAMVLVAISRFQPGHLQPRPDLGQRLVALVRSSCLMKGEQVVRPGGAIAWLRAGSGR